MSNKITVLIADDHPIFRKGLREIIEAEPSLQLVGEAEDGARAGNVTRLASAGGGVGCRHATDGWGQCRPCHAAGKFIYRRCLADDASQ